MKFSDLTDWSNLYHAVEKASKGKRGKTSVAMFDADLEAQLFAIQTRLQQHTWQPSPYINFYIHDPKIRLISAAPFADRVVHHALCNIIEPVFERSFIQQSYANRIGKGNHRALNHAQQCARKFNYVLQLDIQKFFPSINHQILKNLLRKKIHDKEILWLIDQILASSADIQPNANNSKAQGLPIGNLTSQFWGNVYLNPLDHFIKRTLRCSAYVRYVDDMLLFAHDKKQLWQWKRQLQDYLFLFGLVFHQGTHPKPVTEGISFLGFRIFPDKRRLKKRKGIQYQRRLKRLIKQYELDEILVDTLFDSIMAWNSHASYGNTLGLRKAVFSCLPEDIAIEAGKRYKKTLRKNCGY